jgi:hypothetical protein
VDGGCIMGKEQNENIDEVVAVSRSIIRLLPQVVL